MANLYFSEESDSDVFAAGSLLEVTGDEARHAVRVSRLRTGERTLVGDGRGTIASGTVQRVDRDRFAMLIDDVHRVERPTPRTVLVQALAKGDRDERAIEQATEFGIDEVVPWEAARSVSRWGVEKAARGAAKWARIVREASKQSVRPWIPDVHAVVDLQGLCDLASSEDDVVVLHPGAPQSLSDWARGSQKRQRAIYLVVGPEGGITDEELEALAGSGAAVVGLGAEVLRTSSAGPAALAVLNVALGRW